MIARNRRWVALGLGLLVAGVLPAVWAPAPAGAAVYDQRWAVTGAGMHRASPTYGDLSVGRVALVADMGGIIRAIRADGTVAWRSAVDPRPGTLTAVEGAPAVGDLDGMSGPNEVVVGAGSNAAPTAGQWGGVVAYNGDGTTRWRFLTQDKINAYTGGPPDGRSDGVFSSPAIGDVDGDRRNDVVFGSWDNKIYALNGDGTMLSGFPIDNTDTVFSSPALYDLDGDQRQEIVIGGDQTHNSAVPSSFNGGILRVLDWSSGRVTQRTRGFNDILASSPAIGDIDGDGRFEAVFTTGNFYHASDSHRVWAVHLDDLSNVPGWPQTTAGELFGSPALGDLLPGDGGRPEVTVGDLNGNVYAWRGNGQVMWVATPGPNGNSGFYGGPSIGDLDGNGTQDVAIGYGFSGALLLRGNDGGLIRWVGAGAYASLGTPAIVDFGGGVRRLVVGGWDPRDGTFQTGRVAAFELPATGTADWPVFRKDPRHRGAPSSDPAPATGSRFTPLTPVRILDTRTGTGAPPAPVPPRGVVELQVTGRGGVPVGATAVVLNVTSVGMSGSRASYLTAWPTGEAQPNASNLNYVAGEVIPNLVTVKLGTGGKVSLYNDTGSVHVLADVAGYYATGAESAFNALQPARILDTRTGNGAPVATVGPNGVVELQVTGRGEVPAGATGVVLNVTAVGLTGTPGSYITAWPTGSPLPNASNLNLVTGQTIPNLVVAKLGTGGKVSLRNDTGQVHLLADVAGYFGTTGSTFIGVAPYRLLDTRTGRGAPLARISAGGTVEMQVTDRGAVDPGATAVVLNVTAVGLAGSPSSYITVWPSGTPQPNASNLNMVTGQVVPNSVVAKIGANGKVSISNAFGNVDVLADVAGYFTG